MNDITSLWNNVSKLLEIKIGKINYGTWIEPLKLIKLDEEHLMLHAPNQFTKRMIQIRFLKDIESTIRFYLKLPPEATLSVSIIEPSEEYEFNEEENNHTSIIFKNNESFIEDTDMNDEIKAELTFNNFICGKNNKFALANTKAVAENPAKEYNPLFIWGGVGLGKTHLMKACAHQIKLNNPSAKVFYFTAEKFANELIKKIQHKKMDDFRNKYRNLDILLVDDIQFIAGKKTTEEEFFKERYKPAGLFYSDFTTNFVGFETYSKMLDMNDESYHSEKLKKNKLTGFVIKNMELLLAIYRTVIAGR